MNTHCTDAVNPKGSALYFEPYSLEALKKALPYIQKSPYLCNDLSAGTLFMWREGGDIGFCVWNDTFVFRQNIGEKPAFSWPYGADPDGMIDQLILYTRERGLPLRFYAVDDELLQHIREDERLRPVMFHFDRKWSDYIYSFEDAETFRGKKFSGQRNHINKFKKLYGEPNARLLRAEDHDAVVKLLDLYESEHTDGNALERMELQSTRELLDVYEELGLFGACLLVDDEMVAFSIGEIVGESLLIHVEKALKSYEGAYPTMYQSFVRLVDEKLGHPLRYVNREDDSGDPGLRTSKQQYQPVMMVNKYLVHAFSPAGKVEQMPVLHAGDIVLTEIRPEDKAAYLRLNTDVENNRYWGYDYREDDDIPQPPDEDTFYDSLQSDLQAGESINFAVRLSETGEMIGEAILWNFGYSTAELGCRLMPAYHGKGYGRAAFGAALEYGEKTLGLKVWARCFQQNQASYRMITASGLHETRKDETYYYFER